MPIFARHETFHPRYGWFRKAYATAATDGGGFSADDAPVIIGVGKNMVRSIKFWGQAAKVITADPDAKNKRATDMVPTKFGQALFGSGGWDPYMEDPGSVWLLHWMLLAPPSQLPVWWLVFNELHAVNFDDALLEEAVGGLIEAAGEWSAPHPSALAKDVSALLRTYAPAAGTARANLADVLDCPMRELGLISRSAATGKYRLVFGTSPTLPDPIVVAAVLDYVARCQMGGKTMTLAHLATEPGSPGRAFRLDEPDLHDRLERVSYGCSSLELLAPTGAHQLAWHDKPAKVAVELLNEYYSAQPSEPIVGPEGDMPAETYSCSVPS